MKKLLSLCLSLVMLLAPALASDWPQFLGEESAQGLCQADSPTTAAQLSLRWQLTTSGEGANGMQGWTDVPGTPILVGDYVYYYSSQYLRKVELTTGKEVATAKIYGTSVNQFFCNIAYGDGKIFVPCQTNNLDPENVVKGCFLRVYDAETLRQLYVTEKIPGGQMQSPIMYHDGYVVTGTYGRNSVYACFSTADTDPARSDEVKTMAWSVAADTKYGFSFCGAAFRGDYCYFAGSATLYVVNYKTGESRTYDLGEGYVSHSTLAYSQETQRLYVPANNPQGGASVFSFALGQDGMPQRETALEWQSGTAGGGTQSSPVIYKGRLYLGGGGGTMGSAEPFHVIDAVTMDEIYSVPILSKGSAAVTTAYATEENGYQVYLYMIPYAPVNDSSQLWIIKDRQGQTKAEYEVVENVGKSQYCSQSVLLAEDGAMIWYNDAAALYCYENKEAPQEVFTDVRHHEAKEDILYLYDRGVVNGIGGTTRFAPEGTLTRSEFVQMLSKLSAAELENPQTQQFQDVAVDAWYAKAVHWASTTGLTTGVGGNRFAPLQTLTRQEVLVFAQRFVSGVMGQELPEIQEPRAFSDQDAIAPFAVSGVEQLQRWGILKADGSALDPTGNATRAYAAQIVAAISRAMA